MRSRSSAVLGLLACAGLAAGAGAADAGPEAEAALRRAFDACAAATNDHARAAAACAAAERAAAGTPLACVARGRMAWHELQRGERAAAATLFSGLTNGVSGALLPAADSMARRWLTRLDRERVAAALRQAYLQRIEYPAALAWFTNWPAERRPPPADRFGMPWSYRPSAYRHVAGTLGQKYALESVELKADSSLEAALARPYPDAGGPRVERRMEAAGGAPALVVGESGAAGTTVVQEGSPVGRWTLVYVGQILAVFSDGDGWSLAAVPP